MYASLLVQVFKSDGVNLARFIVPVLPKTANKSEAKCKEGASFTYQSYPAELQ